MPSQTGPMYFAAIEYALELLDVIEGQPLPQDIDACGCEAEEGLQHLIWHLAERAPKPSNREEGSDA